MQSSIKLPKVFIASPLFNPAQISIISTIESLCEERGLPYYSARRHSGSHLLSPEQRKVRSNWDSVFQSNEQGLIDSDLMIAVLSYELPTDTQLGLLREHLGGEVHRGMSLISPKAPVAGVNNTPSPDEYAFQSIELADNGTVFEVGYFRALGKPVVAFHPTAVASNANLMLTHGCDGFISGVPNLTTFFASVTQVSECGWHEPDSILDRLKDRMRSTTTYSTLSQRMSLAEQFDWGVCDTFAPVQKETF